MVAGLEIHFSRLLLFVIDERAFKASTNYFFPCMIFWSCWAASVPIWHTDILHTSNGTVDIGIIRDESNEVEPNREPRVDVQSLGENLAYTVEQAQRDDHAASKPTESTPVDFTMGTSMTLSSSRSTPQSTTLVPIGRFQKLEFQMDTLLHHIHPWMQKSIVEAEDRIKKKVAHKMRGVFRRSTSASLLSS